MKKILSKSFTVILAGLGLFLFSACNNLLNDNAADSSDSKSSPDYANVKIELADFSQKAARDIFPTVEISNFKNFALSGKWEGQENDRNLASGDTWSEFTSTAIPIQTGTWDFTLQALSSDNRSFVATLENQVITTSTSTLTFSNLHATDDYGHFSISVTVDKTNVSANTDIQVQFTLSKDGNVKFNPGAQPYSGTALTFNPANEYYFTPGDYDMEIKLIATELKDSSNNPIVLNTYKDTLHVIAGFTSTKNLSLKANPVYDISYEYDGGTLSVGTAGPALFSRKSSNATLPTLTKTGYNFLGWFDADSGGNKYTDVSISSTTYYARFTPKSYTVKHYFQPVGPSTDPDDYVQDLDNYPNQTITITGNPVNETTNATAHTIEGFENQEIDQATSIAADGSTVVNVYYNRKSFDVTYKDGQGGTTITGLGGSYQFGATVDVDFDNIPTKVGYDFTGWKNGGTTYTSTGTTSFTMGAAAVELVAQWSSHPYHVVFHFNGGKYNGESVHTEILDIEEDNMVEPSDFEPTRDSFTFGGWYTDEELTDAFTGSEINLSNPNNNPLDFHDWDLYVKWIPPSNFVFVKGGTVEGAITGSSLFISGSSKTISDMLMSDHEVTQSEYETYCMYGQASTYQPTSLEGQGENYAVYGTSWYDAIVYCNLRSRAENLTPVYAISGETNPIQWDSIQKDDPDNPTKYCGPDSNVNAWNNITMNALADGYRLPTSAEWEYAARNGNNGIPEPYYDYAFSSSSDTLADIAWYSANSNSKVHEVKTDKTSGKDSANALGIYDMCGNVNEWCWDKETGSGTMRTLRGGHCTCSDSAQYNQLAISYEGHNYPYQRIGQGGGFRVVRSVFSSE